MLIFLLFIGDWCPTAFVPSSVSGSPQRSRCVLPGLANLKCFQTVPLISQNLAAPHVTENKLPCFLGMDFHESLSSKVMFSAMFSSAVQSSNNPLECCLSPTTDLCLVYTHLDFCSLLSLFFKLLRGESKMEK